MSCSNDHVSVRVKQLVWLNLKTHNIAATCYVTPDLIINIGMILVARMIKTHAADLGASNGSVPCLEQLCGQQNQAHSTQQRPFSLSLEKALRLNRDLDYSSPIRQDT